MRNKLLTLLFLSFALSTFGQKIHIVDPPNIIRFGSTDDCAILGWQRNILFGGVIKYHYYECSCDDGSSKFLKWTVKGYNKDTKEEALATLPSGWSTYVLPCIISDKETLAYWELDGKPYPLKARYFNDSLYLTQSINTNPDVFVVRRSSLLQNIYAEITFARTDLDSTCFALFAGGDDGTGGLTEPPGFSTPSGYTLYYAGDSTKLYWQNGSSPSDDAGENLMPEYSLTLVNDRVNFSQFEDIPQKSGLTFSFGQGSPYFSDLYSTTPALHLKKGVDRTYNGAFASSTSIPNTRLAGFYDATGMWATIANEIKGTYPDLAHVTTARYPNLSAVSRNSAIELGRTAFYYRFNAPSIISAFGTKKFSMMSLDEEIWDYPTGQKEAVSAFLLGMMEAARNEFSDPIIHLYGNNYAPTNFRLGATQPYPLGESHSSMESYASNFRLNTADYKASGAYSDFGVMYYKTPIPSSQSYYQMAGSSYLLDGSGRRQFRTDAFTDTQFGKFTNFYTTNTASYLANVSSDHYQAPANRRHDVYWSIEQQYRHHDMIQLGLKARSNAYGHGGNITYRYNEGIKPFALIRLETEPFTVGGNGHDIRELGQSGVESLVAITGMSGLWGFDTWQDGTGSEVYPGRPDSPFTSAPTQDSPLYGASNSYARFESALATIQAIKKTYDGIEFDSNFRYFHFSKYYDSFINKEVLSNGFYNGTKLGMYFLYPYHDVTDTTQLTVHLGDYITKTVQLVGRRPAFYQWEIDGTVTPDKLLLTYTNIDGVDISVTGNIENHYDLTPEIIDSSIPSDLWSSTVDIGKYGYAFGGDYTTLASQLGTGTNIFNYHGNTVNNQYPPERTQEQGVLGYTTDYVAVMWPSHAYNYKYYTSGSPQEGKIAKVHIKVFEKSTNRLVLEVYDTKGGYSGARDNNHPNQCVRWIKKGDYTIWVKNLSEDADMNEFISFGTTQDQPDTPSIFGSYLAPGNTLTFDVTISDPVPGVTGHLLKFNPNIRP